MFNLPSCPLWIKLGGFEKPHLRTNILSLAFTFNLLILQTGYIHKLRFWLHYLRTAHWKPEWQNLLDTFVHQEQNSRHSQMHSWCSGIGVWDSLVKNLQNPPMAAYPALCLSFLSRIPSLETSLLNTKMPITMLTCQTETKVDLSMILKGIGALFLLKTLFY